MRTSLLVCFIAGGSFALAQDLTPGSTLAPNARLNFAVPDAPAFTVLNYTPSIIIRPTSVKEVALAISDFINGGGVLPRNVAAEFSPGMLIGGRSLTIRQYNANPFWYRTRISAATRTYDDNTGRIQAALGVRFTFTDDADPRTDRPFIENLSRLATDINRAVARKVQETPPDGSGPIPEGVVDVEALEQEVEVMRTQQREERWNANIWEFAAAARFGSRDSLARNSAAEKYQGWIAGSFRVEQWGQFIFNASGSVERAANFKMDSTAFAMSARFYFGSNDMKVFGEGQITALEKSPALYLFNVGGELNAISSFWLEFAAGFEKRGAEPALIRTSFNIRWSLPEVFAFR
jgi:hypothetical protein